MQSKTHKKKRRLGNIPFLSVIFSISLSISVLGIFGVLLMFTNGLKKVVQNNIDVHVFLQRQTSEAERDYLLRVIGESEYVNRKGSTPVIYFVSKEDAAKKFTDETGEAFIEFLGDNPLRDGIVVNISSEYQHMDSLKMIQEKIEKEQGVYEVAYVANFIDKINNNVRKIGTILLIVAILLIAIVVFLMNNTIKLAMYSQRFLIRSMQLVGAKNSFIMKPFLQRSLLYGFLSGVLACIFIYFFLNFVYSNLQDLQDFENQNSLIILALSLIFTGMAVGFLSTYSAVKKYLKLSLDELY